MVLCLVLLAFIGAWAAPCDYGVSDACKASLCPNSPFTAAQLKEIQRIALGKLDKWHPLSNPNPLVPNLDGQFPTPKPCRAHLANGNVINCGWAPTYRNANASLADNPYDNPDVWYGTLYTGTACKTRNEQMLFPEEQSFKLREDEAVVWLGCTPPNAQYFSYSKSVVNLTDTQLLKGLIGEALNNLVIKTASVNGSPFGAATLIIYAADQDIADAITNAYVAAGFPASAINVDPFPVSEINLGTNGQVTSSTSTLGIIARIYKFTVPEAVSYIDCVRDFPYVKFTPLYPRLITKHIAEIETWRPDDVGILFNSEFGFLPVLQGIVSTVQSYTNGVLAAAGYTQASQYVSQPFRYFDYGLKWILESRSGVYGTRDASYNAFPLQLITNYGFTPKSLNFSFVCGIDHTKAFTTNIPNLVHNPTALYYNYAVYAVKPGAGLSDTYSAMAGGVTQTSPLNIAAFPPPVQAGFGQVFGRVGMATAANFYCSYIASNCDALHAILPALPCSQVNTSVPFGTLPMPVLFRAYVNPVTATAPSDVTLMKPFMVNYNYVHP